MAAVYNLVALYHTERSVLGSTSLMAAHHFVGHPLVDVISRYRLHHSDTHNARCHEFAYHEKLKKYLRIYTAVSTFSFKSTVSKW